MKLTPAIVRPTARTIINSSSENPRLFVDFIISFGEEEPLIERVLNSRSRR
jgi:hypothetical protein